ncbi:NACHT domain-containing NTPase [Luteolibacter sp. Populi]|uniref:NACHT domain-containing protein n=1 Tax=Luteolibacter sp. Populi TaxID=3230487 RepID=UPI003465EDF9
MAIERTFHDIPEGKLSEADQQAVLVSMGWSHADGWPELLRSKRILIISEAGGGKTYECRAQRQRLWDEGEPAFFLELATLASSDVRSMLDHDEEVRLEAWLAAQSDIATFFLDSFDELKLSLGSLEQALKRLNKAIAGQLNRARIIITTRPIPFDELLVRRLLPISPTPAIEIEVSADTFAQVAMHGRPKGQDSIQENVPKDWRTVALMPLSDAQIAEFARAERVDDPEALLADLRRRNAEEFARRPQDLIELCADWRDSNRIRTHREQVEANIRIKLKPREDRPEPAELSVDKAIEGASRLALAMMVTRRLTLRHSAEADIGREDVAFDPSVILSNWSPDERKALLERPLFGFASYGRVRFHHRSVAEYLAATRIQTLRSQGMSASALKRLIFADTRGRTIVRPSKRSIAGWLALEESLIFETLRDCEPAVLLNEGDPASLIPSRRSQALRSYVTCYGHGGWRGLNVPQIQIHRFASPELGAEIYHLWTQGIENPEIRELLLQLIESGRITECLGIAQDTVVNTKLTTSERLAAVEALVAMDHPDLGTITSKIAEDEALWPYDLAREVALRLFPKHLSIKIFCQILTQTRERDEESLSNISWRLVPLIVEANLDAPNLEALRDEFYRLASQRLVWENEWEDILSDHPQLSVGLASVCIRGISTGITDEWLRASALALRLSRPLDGGREVFEQLESLLGKLPADINEKLFWIEDGLLQSIQPATIPWKRYARVALRGTAKINQKRDGDWIRAALASRIRSTSDRAMLLEGAMRLSPSREEWEDYMLGLKPLVADQPELVAVIEDRLKPSPDDEETKRWEAEEAERQEQRKRQENEARASWVTFWSEVVERPDSVFSKDRSDNTVWHLWKVMRKADKESHASGWNRRFIEAQFGKETADRLRRTLMDQWRSDRPSLESERPEDQKNSYLVRWQLGLAAIYAEAEDPLWATKLSAEEAKLAVRYAMIELNKLPSWMESLVEAHPEAVSSIVGQELKSDLEREEHSQWHSMLLQKIGRGPGPVIAALLPCLLEWFDLNNTSAGSKEAGAADRLQSVSHLLEKHGDRDTLLHLRTLARERLVEDPSPPFARVWLQLLMRFDPGAGVEALENRIRTIEPAKRSEAVTLLGTIFGGFLGARNSGVSLTDSRFTPPILLRLLRLSYQHVRPEDDEKHQGAYSPDERDDAERFRGTIVNVLLQAKGEEAWAAKLEMAAEPVCSHFKDRILAVAEESWAEEIDALAFNDTQAIALDRTGEAPPSTNEAMFGIMVDRLEDIDDLLLRDVSPREAWAGFTDERVMRREIARELTNHANGVYKVDQEAATADEKETDIRLRSTASAHEAVIELKLADGRSARNLRDTLKDQLVTKYMAAETSRSGSLMFTLAKERRWEHPDNGSSIDFTELVTLLREEANRLMSDLGGTLRLHIHPLDLRPRLTTEAKQPKAQ